jgi:N6-L-threonylcarbamoyladenine synthase
VGAGVANALAYGLSIPAIGIHHLEGHLLSPLLAEDAPAFPFAALLVSGGHTQLMRVDDVGRYRLLGETVDDAAGEAFDKTAKLLGLPYPGGPALSALAAHGHPSRFRFPRPMLGSDNLDFSFSGLKTAAVLACRSTTLDEQTRADIAAGFQQAVVDVLVAKCLKAMDRTALDTLVVAGGVGANRKLRDALAAAGSRAGFQVHFPPIEYCTDNGAMIALAGALRLERGRGVQVHTPHARGYGFTVRPRWDLGD